MRKVISLVVMVVLSIVVVMASRMGKCTECGTKEDVSLYKYISIHEDNDDYINEHYCNKCIQELYKSSNYLNVQHMDFDFLIILVIIGGGYFGVYRNGDYWGKKVNELLASKGYNYDWYWKGFWMEERAIYDVLGLPDLKTKD